MGSEKCKNCKHLGNFLNGRSRLCQLHGHCVLDYYRACFWKNQDIHPAGTLNENGVILNSKHVVLFQSGYKRIGYDIVEYSGRWFAGVNVVMTDGGHSYLPNVHNTAYATKEKAIMSAMLFEYEVVKKRDNEQDKAIFLKTIEKVQSPSLF